MKWGKSKKKQLSSCLKVRRRNDLSLRWIQFKRSNLDLKNRKVQLLLNLFWMKWSVQNQFLIISLYHLKNWFNEKSSISRIDKMNCKCWLSNLKKKENKCWSEMRILSKDFWKKQKMYSNFERLFSTMNR